MIGEFVISEEGRAEILREGRYIFRMMCEGKKDSLPLTEGRVLAVACVLLTRNSINANEGENEQDHAEIWQPILEGLNFPEISEKTGCSEQVARRYLCDVLKNRYNVRFFADGGQKYYNTLRLHALSPEWAIKNLYNVLYAFYHKNLECSYYPGSNVASMFISGIRRRWVTTTTKVSEKQSIQSDRLSSSMRELFVLCPKYMAAVCDALLEKIDRIVQGDLTRLDEKNRWDVLLQEWYQSKTAYEKSRMTNDRKAAVRRKIVDKKENIRPEFLYENNNICISIPGIRLPEIQEAPVLELYQNEQMIYRQRLTIYGNDVLWSTRSHKILLNQVTEINWKKRFCFMIRITSGQNEIFCSGSDLFREYLCFTSTGNETCLVRCNQLLRLIVRKSAKLVIDDPETRYTEEPAPYRINDTTSQLYQFPWTNGQFRIPLPAIMERKHSVQLKDFDSGEIAFQRSYTIVPGLKCEFDRPFYLDSEIEGKLFIHADKRRMVHHFQLQPGMDKVSWQMAGLSFEIAVPKVYAEICEKNAFYLSKSTWYEELKDSFLTIQTPEDVNCAVVFDNKLLSLNHTGNYEIGTAIDNRSTSVSGALLGIVVSSKTWKLEWKLTTVQYLETFESNPISQEGRKILWNPIDAGYIGGDEQPTFRLELENDQQEDPFQYVLPMRQDTVERNFPCRTGTYKYTLWRTNRKRMFTNLPDLLLLEGEISVKDPPEDRFASKYIILTRAYYSDPQRGTDVNAKMKHDRAMIDYMEYGKQKQPLRR